MRRKRNIFIRLMSFVMTMMLVFTGSNLSMKAQAATGLNLSGKTIQGYAYSNSNFPVYNSTGAGKRKIGTCYGTSDLLTIRGVGRDGWCSVTYPAGKGTKTGYCQTLYLFQNPNFSTVTGKVQSNITTYKKADCKSAYGATTSSDQVFIVGKNNGNTQIVYPCSGYYKTAWVKGNYNISNGRFSKSGGNTGNSFLGCLDAVTSSASGQIELKGWVFNWNELYKHELISVCVGGTFYSGAPKYTITANAYRPDVNKVYSGVGNYHGFSSTIKVTKTGNQTVYVYAGNGSKLLGSKNVNIQAKTNGGTGVRITQGKYVITTAVNTSKCLDVHSNSSHNGANIQIFEASNNNPAQTFSIESMGGEWYKIVHVSSSKVLDVCGGVAKSGVNVQLYQYNGSPAQQWRFLNTGNGMYYIENRLGYKLDVCGGVSTNGTNVWVYKTNYCNSQRWKLIPVNATTLSYGLYKNKSAHISCGFDGYKSTEGKHEGIDIVCYNGAPVYSLTSGTVVRVAYGKNGTGGLSTIAIYDSSANKTVIYLHSNPVSLKVGQSIAVGQKIATQGWRGVSNSSGSHTHVEVRNGKQGYAAKSVNDQTLDNPNPTSYWTAKGYTIQ